jgi:iron complex outermembrane receptor protein
MNAAYQQQHSFMDFIKTKKYVVAPVVQYNFSPGTYVLAEYDLIRITADGGSSVTKVGTAADVLKDRVGNNYAGDPGLPQSYTQTQNFRLFLSRRLSERWRISLQSKYTITPAETWYLMSDNYSPVNFDSTNITRRMPVFNSITGRVAAAQVYVNGQLNSGNHIEHRIAAGIDYNYSKDNYSNAYGQHSFVFDRTHPQYGLPADSVRMLSKPSLLLRENGWWSAFAYSTTRLYNNWLLNFGGRFTLNTPVTTDAKRPLKDETAFSPRLGVTRLFGAYTAVYALYDQSFIPQPGADFEGNDFKPLRGNSFELGVKREWFQQRLSTSLSAYRIVKNNLLVTDLQHRGYRRQIGQATSTGVDVDVMGRISERLSVSANYAYTHAVTSKDSNKDNEGARLAYIPEQTINSWIQYSIPLQASSRLSISAGQSTVTRTATYTRDVYLKGYTKLDAGMAYDAGKWYVRVVADNVTNRRYFSSGDILVGSIYPGVKSYYYVEGAPLSVKAFVGIRL